MHPDSQPSPLPSGGDLAPHHAELLTSSGITVEHAADHGVRSVLTDAELPEDLQGLHFARTPGILFEWNSPTHGVVHQFRPDVPVENDQGDPVKYVFPTGSSSVLNALRPQGSTILLVEGTKQALAAAEYAPIDTAVYGMAGCWGWRKDGVSIPDLSVVYGREVIVVLDADAARNLDVYNAGVALREALQAEGALTVRFMRLPASGKAGLDDVLGARAADTRTQYLRTLIEKVQAPKTKGDIEKAGVERPADKAPGKKTEDKPSFVPDPQKLMVEATDLDVADAFVALHGDQVRFESTTERWLTYNIGKWDAEGGFTLARTLFRDMVKNEIVAVSYSSNGEVQDERAWLTCQPRIGHVLGFASANRVIHVRAQDLDPDPWLWNAANCVIGLGKDNVGDVLAHDPDLMMTQQSPVVYDPDAECPEFMRFIEWALPDPEVRAYVQRILGLSMVGKTVLQQLFVFTGDGRNGKGTLIRMVSKVFGPYATGIKDDVLVETRFESHATKLATFFKKRLATTDELPAHAKWNVALVKKLTGGDSITANYMRQDDFTFEPTHSLILSTNHRPHVGEDEYAFWRRYREVPFTRTLSDAEIDEHLEDRISSTELSGILNWLLDGLIDYHDHGLPVPKAVTEASASTERTNLALHPFVRENFRKTDDMFDEVTGPEVASAYKKWLGDHRDAVAVKGAKFHQEFCTLLGLDHKAGDASRDAGRSGNPKIRRYKTVRFIEDEDLLDEEEGTADATADTADGTADLNDQGTVETAGQHMPTAVTAVTADVYAVPPTRESLERVSLEDEVSQVADKGETSAVSAVLPYASAPAGPFPQVSTSAATAADWVGLMALDAPRLPYTTCRDCDTVEAHDDEVGIFKLCPECTSGSLRKPTV